MAKNNHVPDRIQAVWNKPGGDEGVDRLLNGELILTPVEKAVAVALLAFVGTVTVPAITAPFLAKTAFVVNITDSAEVKISALGDNFIREFIRGEGKVEAPSGEVTLRYSRLTRNEYDTKIVTELGGDDAAETPLSTFFGALKLQGHGQKGALLTNGWANIFYVRNTQGVLLAVYANWNGNGWNVNANPLDNQNRWNDDNQVFSRNYLLSSLSSGEVFF